MSAFLGPIHNWLFHKILFQDQLTAAIIEGAEEKGYNPELKREVDNRYGSLPKGELKDIIDESNIHGWLQNQVTLVEYRLAYVVTTLLKEDQERLNCIMDIAYNYGKAHGIDAGATARMAYDLLEDSLLNGMPCDHVNKVTQESNEKICWEQTLDIHEPYWAEIGGKIKYYYDIREALIKGMIAGSKITFYRINDGKYVLC